MSSSSHFESGVSPRVITRYRQRSQTRQRSSTSAFRIHHDVTPAQQPHSQYSPNKHIPPENLSQTTDRPRYHANTRWTPRCRLPQPSRTPRRANMQLMTLKTYYYDRQSMIILNPDSNY